MLHSSHDPILVGVSFIVACVASFAALQLAGRVLVAEGGTRILWLFGSAFTMGVGIWSMHFVAMLAFHLGMPIAYDVVLLIISVLVAIAASFLAFVTVSRPSPRIGTLVGASLFMGPAIAGMHYIGMAAMRMAAVIEYDRALVAVSVVIAVTASLAALHLFVTFRDDNVPRPLWGKPASAVLMGVAVCGMHYTGMAAARFVPRDELDLAGGQLMATDGLAYAVGIAATLIAGVAVVAVMLDRFVRAKLAGGDVLRRSEELLRESQERLRFALAAANMTTWELDVDQRMIYRTDGAPFSAARTEPLDAFLARVHADDRHLFEQALSRTGTGEPLEVDFRLILMDGTTRWINAKGQRAHTGPTAGKRLVGLSIDITQRRHLEEQFRQAQKMEAVGQLAGGIAHDFNNLLTVITGNIEILLESVHATDLRRGELHDVLSAADRAAGLTRQLLAFSRKQLMQPRPVDLNAVIRNLQPMLQRLIGEDIVIATDLDPSIHAAMADRGQLEQILMNLSVNARDAMPTGGTLRIGTGASPGHRAPHSPRVDLPSGDYVLLRVSDTGTGMDPAVQLRVFEPFFTTKEPGKGTGLGLSTVYGIVRQSGGHIFVDSEPGAGATFTIYLREASGARQDVPADAASGLETLQASATILLCEDEPGVRKLACQILERQGYRVLEAAHGAEALEVAARYDGVIHGMVTDIVMPGMGGRELSERLVAVRPGLRVLFMSGYTDDTILRHGLDDPSTAFLAKPFSVKGLVAALRAALEAPPRHPLKR